MITVHHLNNSHSHVVLWLLEELGLDYNIVKHQRDPKTFLSPDTLRAVHRIAKAPTIEDHGLAMVESTGIILYLLESYGGGKLRPKPNTAEAMQFYQWLTYIEGSARAPIAISFALRRAGTPDDNLKAFADESLKRQLTFLDESLAGQDTIVKSMFTAADIQLTFYEELVEGLLGGLDPYANLKAHVARMRARTGYKRAEEKGGPVGFLKMSRARA